jgi:glutamyl-tRNA synthetase/nondiscriminating glutamyl-tRNA synthetase
VGNVRTAVFNWLLARGQGGRFVLRIEDSDAERSTLESDAAILRDLQWLGLDWDEGPDVGGPFGPYRLSERFQLYQDRARGLLDAGRAYYCFCTTPQLEADRERAVAEGRPAVYQGTCRAIPPGQALSRVAAGEPAGIRFRVPDDRADVAWVDLVRGELRFHRDVIGDSIILRADRSPAYNFAVVVDDALMRMTHVVRGEDHISNTPRQILLYEALGFELPAFAHLSMVLGPDHSRLSKRHGATSIAEFREKGYLPEALVNYLALLGWSPRLHPGGGPDAEEDELMPALELARRFSLERVGHSAGVFDEEKLAWVNRHYLKAADAHRIAELSLPFFERAGRTFRPDEHGLEFLASTMAIATSSVDRLEQVPARLASVFDYDAEQALKDASVREEMRADGASRVARALAEELQRAPRLDREHFRQVANEIKGRTGQKGKALFHPIRIALTGMPAGPELDLLVPAIERGAELGPDAGLPPIVGCRERAAAFVRTLDHV